MRSRRLAVRDWIIDQLGSISPAELAFAAKQKWPNLEFIPALESLGVRGIATDPAEMMQDLPLTPLIGKAHRIPVCYERGLDLGELGLSIRTVAQVLHEVRLTIVAIGFQPGFPYMTGLPEVLAGFERRSEPRTRLSKGSVGVARDMIGIYPAELPGGWNIIGQTPLTICDLDSDFFPLNPGDTVTLEPISEAEFQRLEGDRLAD